MASFEALYGRKYRLSIGWFEIDDLKPLVMFLVNKAQEKVRFIHTKLLATQCKQQGYVDHTVRDMEFKVGEKILLKVSPMKGVMRFGKWDTLIAQYIFLFEIFEEVYPVGYRLALPLGLLGVHSVSYVSKIKRYHVDVDYIIK